MRIDQVQLIAYGGFADVALDFARQPDVPQIVYGPNESGKSTALRAILAWLFGIPTRTNDNYLHQYSELRVGGRLRGPDDAVLECVRRKGTARTLLTLDEQDEVDESQLQRMLGGIDEATFQRSFGLDHERLVVGGRDITSGQGEVGEILFSAGAGVGRLAQVRDQLEEERGKLYVPRGQNRELNKLLAKLKGLRADLAGNTLSVARYRQANEELEQAQQQATTSRLSLEQSRQSLRTAETRLAAIPVAASRRSLLERLSHYGDLPDISDDFSQRRRQAETESRVAENAVAQTTQRIVELEKRRAGIPDPQPWLDFAARVESLAGKIVARTKEFESLRKVQRQLTEVTERESEVLQAFAKRFGKQLAGLRLGAEDLADVRAMDAQRPRLEEQLRTSRRGVEQATFELTTLQSKESVDVQANQNVAIDKALATIDAPQRLLEDIAAVEVLEARTRERAEKLLKLLIGFDGDLDSALNLELPLPVDVNQLATKWKDADAQLKQVRDTQRKNRAEQEQLVAQLSGLTEAGGVPSEHELMQLRQRRDELVASLSKADRELAWQDTLTALQRTIAEADRSVDAMRNAADLVARRLRLECDQATLQKQATQLASTEQTALQAFEEIDACWRRLWRELGVEAGSPEAMEQWLDRHRSFVEAGLEWHHELRRLEQLGQRRDQWCDLLHAALDGANVEDTPPHDDLIGLHSRATLFSEQALKSQRISERHQEELQAAAANCRRAEHQLELCQREWDEWLEQWRLQVARVTGIEDLEPELFRQWMDAREQLNQHQRERATLSEQVTDLEEELSDFTKQTWQLGRSLMESQLAEVGSEAERMLEDESATGQFDVETAVRVLSHWRSVVQRSQQNRQTRDALAEEIDASRIQLDQQQQELTRWQSMLAALCREVACQRTEELPELEQKIHAKQKLEAELRQVESQFQQFAGSKSLDEFAESLLTEDESELLERIEQLKERVAKSEAELSQWDQRVGAVSEVIRSMDGGGTAAEINQRIEGCLAEGNRLIHRYAVLTLQSSALELAMERYREANEGPVIGGAREIFRELTLGRYETLKAQLDDKGARVLVGLRADTGKLVPANQMSEGTADALYLALRLASLENHLQTRPPLPLILDDILIQLDDQRSEAALRVLGAMAKKTQVIFFTHHQHLLDLAEQAMGNDGFALHQF